MIKNVLPRNQACHFYSVCVRILSAFKNKIAYFLHGFLRHTLYVCEPLNSSIVLASGRLLKANMEIEYTKLVLYTNCQHLINFLPTFSTFVLGANRLTLLSSVIREGTKGMALRLHICSEFQQYCFHYSELK